MLKSMLPHEMQTKPHSSLPLTPRPPIEGEPNGCKQEVADSMVTAGCTKGMVETAEPTEIADVDRTALLGGRPVERACGVDEGDRMECKPQMQLLKEESYCEEIIQRSGIVNEDVPSAQRLPLEGEWTVCMSSEPLTMTVEPYANDGNRNACVYLGGTRWHAGDTSHPEGQSDGSGCQTDRLRGRTDTLSVSNRAVMTGLSHCDNVSTYLGAGGVKRSIWETDGVESQTDVSSGHLDTPSIKTNPTKPTNETANVRLPRKKVKLPDSPISTPRRAPDEPNGNGDLTEGLTVHMDGDGIEMETETAENGRGNVRTGRIDSMRRNSLYTPENERSKPTNRWRRVSIGNGGVYIPLNVQIAVPS